VRSSEGSFESIYRRHAPEIYRYVLALLASPADAEEVTQTAFLNAYRAIERGEHPRNPGAWLRSIALNLCRQRFRQAARRPAEVPLSEHEVAELIPEDESPTLEDLTRALGHLPFNQRAALVMREFEGRSPAQIADALDLSVSAVETLLFRARRSLREQLEGGLTCEQAERAISLQLDGLLRRNERGSLRAHLRECDECGRLARRLRGQRGAMKSLSLLPLPSWLAGASPAGTVAGAGAGAGVGVPIAGSLVAKVAAGALATAAVAAGGYAVVARHPLGPAEGHHVQAARRSEVSSRTAHAASGAALAPRGPAHRTTHRGAPQRHHARNRQGNPQARGPKHSSAGSTLAVAPARPVLRMPASESPTHHGHRAPGAAKTARATEPKGLAQKVRIPMIRKPTASTLKAKAPKASNARGKAPATGVYKSNSPKQKGPKEKGPKEKVPKASPNATERQSMKPSKPSKLIQ
jgi:RNA polymerase sigma factor (sigma-70 family)